MSNRFQTIYNAAWRLLVWSSDSLSDDKIFPLNFLYSTWLVFSWRYAIAYDAFFGWEIVAQMRLHRLSQNERRQQLGWVNTSGCFRQAAVCTSPPNDRTKPEFKSPFGLPFEVFPLILALFQGGHLSCAALDVLLSLSLSLFDYQGRRTCFAFVVNSLVSSN